MMIFGANITVQDIVIISNAFVTVGLLIKETLVFISNKPHLFIKYSPDMKLFGYSAYGQRDNKEKIELFINISIHNDGNKPIIFNQLCLETKNNKPSIMVTGDINGSIKKFTLIPGDSHSFTFSHELIKPDQIKSIIIMDATLRVYKKRIEKDLMSDTIDWLLENLNLTRIKA